MECKGSSVRPSRPFAPDHLVKTLLRTVGDAATERRLLGEWSAIRSATCKAAENDCLERRNSIRPRVSSRVAYKAERGGNELFWSPWKMYPRSQERHRNREATVYLPALGGAGLGLIVRSEYTNARKRRQPKRA